MADFEIKAHDLLPVFRVALTQNGQPVDLTLATGVKFLMASTGYVIKINRAATVEDPAGGLLSYAWVAGDTDTPGQYLGEWQITWPGSKPQTAPTNAYNTISVFQDLDNA